MRPHRTAPRGLRTIVGARVTEVLGKVDEEALDDIVERAISLSQVGVPLDEACRQAKAAATQAKIHSDTRHGSKGVRERRG